MQYDELSDTYSRTTITIRRLRRDQTRSRGGIMPRIGQVFDDVKVDLPDHLLTQSHRLDIANGKITHVDTSRNGHFSHKLTPHWQARDESIRLYCGDVRQVLQRLPARSVHTVITSPPYWGQRDYGVSGQLGSERTPEEFIEVMVSVFREVYRVLRDDGTLWLNMGDSYGAGQGDTGVFTKGRTDGKTGDGGIERTTMARTMTNGVDNGTPDFDTGLPSGNLLGMPWRTALALRSAGWILRQEIIWRKPASLPESQTSRMDKEHEHLFLLSKRMDYYFDVEAIRTPTSKKRSVWDIAADKLGYEHFAPFPCALVEPCILAGTSSHGCCEHCGTPYSPQSPTLGPDKRCECLTDDTIPCTVLDPFMGTGTTAVASIKHGRHCVGIDLSREYTDRYAIPRITGNLLEYGMGNLIPKR